MNWSRFHVGGGRNRNGFQDFPVINLTRTADRQYMTGRHPIPTDVVQQKEERKKKEKKTPRSAKKNISFRTRRPRTKQTTVDVGHRKIIWNGQNEKPTTHLTETETVRRALQIDVQQQNLGRLFLVRCRIVQSRQQRGRQCIRWHQHVETAHKFAQRQVIWVALSVETNGWQQFRSTQLRA